MLVLSRKQNERIVVGGSVVVTVVRISGDKVRLGIEAPADVRVIRDEVADRPEGIHGGMDEVMHEGIAAATAPANDPGAGVAGAGVIVSIDISDARGGARSFVA